jgi:hypothetical protein
MAQTPLQFVLPLTLKHIDRRELTARIQSKTVRVGNRDLSAALQTDDKRFVGNLSRFDLGDHCLDVWSREGVCASSTLISTINGKTD